MTGLVLGWEYSCDHQVPGLTDHRRLVHKSLPLTLPLLPLAHSGNINQAYHLSLLFNNQK